jgi:hypothetical protein
MSRFLANIARRGAGLAPQVVPRGAPIPPWSPAAVPDGATSEPGVDGSTASADAPHVTPDFFPARRAPTAPALAAPSPPSPLRATGEPISPDTARLDDPTPRSGAPPASLPSQRRLIVERATVSPDPPEASASKAPETEASALRPSTRHHEPAPQTPAPPTRAVAVAPRAEQTVAAPSRPPVMELPQAKSQSLASPASATRAATAAAEQPRVHVRIGKVEVRATTPAAAPARVTRPKGGRGFAELRLARAHLDRNYR